MPNEAGGRFRQGGTGKTTVAVNLARTLGRAVDLLDRDVEEPNAHLFLEGRMTGEEVVAIAVLQVDDSSRSFGPAGIIRAAEEA